MESSHAKEPLNIQMESQKTDTDDSESSLAVSVDIDEYTPWLDNTISPEPKVDWCVKKFENGTADERKLTVDVMAKKHKNIVNDIHECKICNKSFKYKVWYEHINTVHSTQSLPCDECHKTFRSPKYLRQHKHRVHLQIKSVPGDNNTFKCPKCSAVFEQIPILRIHLLMAHRSKDQAKTCRLCNSQLKNQSYLNAHMLQVHCDDGKKHQCEVCGKSYKSLKYLRIHKNNIHVKIDGKHYLKDHLRACRCGCRNFFLTEDDLQRHLLSNNLEKLRKLPNYENIQVKIESEEKGWDVISIDS